MKKIFLLIIATFPLICLGQNISALYSFRTYSSPVGNYVEINTSIAAKSLIAKIDKDNNYIKQAELTTIICSDKNTDSAIYVDKRIIKSPSVKDTSSLINSSILDMQRIPLENGNYVVFFELKDNSTAMQPIYYKDVIQMNYKREEVNVSDIMLVDKYTKAKETSIMTKNGYNLEPYMFDVISKNNNQLTYYVEVYNADKAFGKDNYYAITTSIEDLTTNKKIENVQTIKREKANNISVLLSSIDISSLTEGSYYLTVEVRNDKNILYAYKKHSFFKQSDKKRETNGLDIPNDAFVNFIPDSNLDENIKCLAPIVSENQRTFIRKSLRNATPNEKRHFIYQFFKEKNAARPDQAWLDYKKQVAYVNERFSTKIKKGYDTDMGRVFLVYGAPNDIIDEKFAASSGLRRRTDADKALNPEASQLSADGVNYLPYQMWRYDFTPFGESNRMFVFYAKQDNLSEYFLLHSNAKGELQDMYWERTLSRNTLDAGVEGKAGLQFRQGHE
ncbi:MAG: GWxTD domain-containing protein [Bacteroidales bacterium]|jgi:GWxTD domain-containing protein|nr:GWxTD domain-containing protein [Bacteroidales bacterium]